MERAFAFRELIRQKVVSFVAATTACSINAELLPILLDGYGRTVATCFVGGAALGDWLVCNGLALDWPQYSKRKYDDAQREAEQAGRGMWAGAMSSPGFSASVSGEAGNRVTVRTTRTPILENKPQGRSNVQPL
jgi:endonuclease YncB( thermonuclease family)